MGASPSPPNPSENFTETPANTSSETPPKPPSDSSPETSAKSETSVEKSSSGKNRRESWHNQLSKGLADGATGLVRSATAQLGQLSQWQSKWRPPDWWPADAKQLQQAYAAAQNTLTKKALQNFSVDDAKIAEILAKVRAELPTTEALLLGKPQAGKSSIVRGLTGVSAEIVGQGFRPHTQNTARYAYPSEDLPLLIFTDTVGLGDINQDTATIVQELGQELATPSQFTPGQSESAQTNQNQTEQRQSARILILTVKITDFAVDQLRQIALQLRQDYPDVPCLLAVTCLHELYSPEQADHLPYPPQSEAILRAFAALESSFADCFDRSVMIDFTLEEDGYTPVFYGQDALRDALAELLPEAESKAIYQLIDDQEMASTQLGNLYRDVGRRYISAFAVIAATLAAVPLPFATMPVLTALQISMVGLLGKLYGQTLNPSQAGGVASAIAGGFFAQAVGRELIKFIPGFGSVVAASWAAGYTWALGEGACAYFGDLMGGKKPDPEKIQEVMATAFETAKTRFRESRDFGSAQPPGK